MTNWTTIWAVIKGERLDAQKALNRNAGIGLFLLLVTVLNFMISKSGKIKSPPIAILLFGLVVFYCGSWLVARNDEILRNKLLVIQGSLGIPLILAAAVFFITVLYSIAYPDPEAEGLPSRMGYPPGLIAGALFYFGRHISDFSEKFKIQLKMYSTALLAIGIVLEVITLFLFIKVINIMFSNI